MWDAITLKGSRGRTARVESAGRTAETESARRGRSYATHRRLRAFRVAAALRQVFVRTTPRSLTYPQGQALDVLAIHALSRIHVAMAPRACPQANHLTSWPLVQIFAARIFERCHCPEECLHMGIWKYLFYLREARGGLSGSNREWGTRILT